MIPVDGNFILAVAPRFSGSLAQAQMRIVGDISAAFAPTLNHYQHPAAHCAFHGPGNA